MATHKPVGNEHLLGILRAEKFRDWKKQWDANADLKAKRKNPNLLFKGPALGGDGDTLDVKPLEAKKVKKAGGKNYKFKAPHPKLFLRLRVLNEDFTALKNSAYSLTLDGVAEPFEGKTNGQGQLEVEIPPAAKKGTLTVTVPPPSGKKGGAVEGETGMSWEIEIGALNPIREEAPDANCLSGVQQRMNNLGFPCGDVTGVSDDATKNAIKQFQATFGLSETGDPDPGNTQAKLHDVHDKADSIVKPSGLK